MYISVIKSIFINISIIYSFCKLLNYKIPTKLKRGILCIIVGGFIVIDIFLKRYYGYTINIVINIIFQTIILSFFMEYDIFTVAIGLILGNAISYIILVISVIIIYILNFAQLQLYSTYFISGIITFIVQFLLVYGFFKLKKFRNGVYFLKNRKYNSYKYIDIYNI